MAAMLLSIIIYSIWVLSVNGAVEPGVFEGLPGTAFTPLAKKMGPIVYVLGSLFVILGMGMASVHFSLGLFNLVGERLPSQRGREVVLPRRKGRVVFHQRGGNAGSRMSIGLTYLGLKASIPSFLVEAQSAKKVHRKEIVFSGPLDLDLYSC